MRLIIKGFISHFGKLVYFNLNSQLKSISISLKLSGEAEVVTINIFKYEIEKDGSKSFLCLKDVSTSKEWLNILAKKYPDKMKIEIPKRYEPLITRMF
jgi:hypothetical protein